MNVTNTIVALALAFGMAAGAPLATAGDRHVGYYYPEPQTTEEYEARTDTLPQAERAMRVGFVTAVTSQNSNRPYPPQVAIFAKGEYAEKLIIVALTDGRLDTLFRARAEFANMTAAARLLPAFQETGIPEYFTFFDLAKMLGFEQITISDGRAFAHQVFIK